MTLALIALATGAHAELKSELITIDASRNSWAEGKNDVAPTNIKLAQGEAFENSVPQDAEWLLCPNPERECFVDASGFRTREQGGYRLLKGSGVSFLPGTIVGRIGENGRFFKVGRSGFSGTANTAGDLYLFNWDHNTNNNGDITVHVAFSKDTNAKFESKRFAVKAKDNAWIDSEIQQFRALNTELNIKQGETLSIKVSESDTWRICATTSDSNATCETYGDGSSAEAGKVSQGKYSDGDLGNFENGTVVGRIGANGKIFKIRRRGVTHKAERDGELFLFNWDHQDNGSGHIDVTVARTIN